MFVCRTIANGHLHGTTRRQGGGFYEVLCAVAVGIALMSFGCQQRAVESVSDSTIEVTDETFENIVLESDQPVLVEFWAPWCRPCLEMIPTVDAVAESFKGRAVVVRIRIDQNPQTSTRFDVESPPTILVFQDGTVIKRRHGKQNEKTLARLLSDSLPRPESATD